MNRVVLNRLISYLFRYKRYMVIAFIAATVNIILTLLGPIFVGKGIDFIIEEGLVNFKGLKEILMVLIGTIVTASFFHWIMYRCSNRIIYLTIKDIRDDAFQHLHKVPLSYIDRNSHGDIMSKVVNDVDAISTGLLQGLTQIFTGVVTIIGTLIFMIWSNAFIASVVVLLTPLSLLFAGFVAKKSRELFAAQSKTQGEISGYVNEMVGNTKLVKTFGYERRAQDNFEEMNQRLYKTGVASQFISAVVNPSTRFVNGVIYATVGIIGSINVIRGNLSVGQLSAFLTYANQYTKPFNEVSGVIAHLQTALASAKRVFDLIDETEEEPDGSHAIHLEDSKGNVTLSDVSFSYDSNVKLLQNISLSVSPGSRVAIVGPTGCGKTTLINLLMRFYDVNAGEILIDDNKIQDITRRSLRKSYGMVLQDTWLFSGSIRDNIAFGKPDASLDEIVQAAKSAHAHSFIKRLPNGYDTIITEGASNISQGQKQLLCIARVMVSLPPMLILDEATSNIDTRTEIQIQKAFSLMMKGRTSFVVAHRLSTIKESDMILVMKDGNIVEKGRHEELLEQGGFYSSLFQSVES